MGLRTPVTPPDSLGKIEADLEGAKENGFVVADGSLIPNLGSKAALMATQEWSSLKGSSFRVARLNSVSLTALAPFLPLS